MDDWHRMLRVHLDGAFNLGQPAYRAMKRSGYGRFVFITSSAGLFGQPNSAHYAAAKAGTLGLANAIAIEGAAHGILANCVLPFGYSRMVFETIGDGDEVEPDPGFLHAIEPELVVPIVIYLASNACQITHHSFSACAGRFAASSWASATDGSPIATASDGRSDRRASRSDLGRRSVLHPDVDLRRSVQGLRPTRHRLTRQYGRMTAVQGTTWA